MKSDKTPPGHCSISNLIIYSILGIPKIEDVSKWRIELAGCSIDEVEFTGPQLRSIISRAKPREDVKWI
ncbi:MAG: hypothetical protein QXP21_01760 [Desulfurococcaceae archaeon]